MYHAVKDVVAMDDYTLLLTFDNQEKKSFDVKPYLDFGVFKQLTDLDRFKTAHISFDTVEWDGEIDIDPETLYAEGK